MYLCFLSIIVVGIIRSLKVPGSLLVSVWCALCFFEQPGMALNPRDLLLAVLITCGSRPQAPSVTGQSPLDITCYHVTHTWGYYGEPRVR
jgi:hypothetical protein